MSTSSRFSNLALAALALGGALAACTSPFDSQMMLSGYRVVGVEASPPEVGPEATVQLRVHDFHDGPEPVAYQWRVCLFSVGAGEAYACSDARLERELQGGTTTTLDLSPAGLDLRRTLEAFPGLANEDGTPRTFARGFDIWVKLRSGPNCTGCEAIDTVKRVTVREPSAAPNANPIIGPLEVVGAPARGQSVTLRVDTDAPELYVDPASQESKREDYLCSWYTSGGKTDPIRTFDATRETTLTLPDEPGPLEVIVTVRDGRGGLAVSRRFIDLP